MHGDAHPGNMYFRDGKAGLLDWQAVRRGHPARELAYTLITSLTPEDRRAAQRDLLDVYRRALGGGRRSRAGPRRVLAALPAGAQYGYVAPLITAGMGGMQVEDIATEGLGRAVIALDDLETVAAPKEWLRLVTIDQHTYHRTGHNDYWDHRRCVRLAPQARKRARNRHRSIRIAASSPGSLYIRSWQLST